jgi:hypothetical protein
MGGVLGESATLEFNVGALLTCICSRFCCAQI